VTNRELALSYLDREPEEWAFVDPEHIKQLAIFVIDHTEDECSQTDSELSGMKSSPTLPLPIPS
jgi:hypothetical protein